MTSSVYPSYVGPTIEYRFASLYPRWLGNIIDAIPVPPAFEEWLGTVVVLDEYYGVAAVGSGAAALVSALEAGVLARTAILSTTTYDRATGAPTLSSTHEVVTFGSALTTVYATLKAGVLNLTARVGVVQRGQPDVEASDEEPEI